MDIKSTYAIQNYAKSRPATQPDPTAADSPGAVRDLAVDFTSSLKAAEQTAEAALVGDADPHALVEALAQSQLAVETAVTIRDKVVEAYQEILRMPV